MKRESRRVLMTGHRGYLGSIMAPPMPCRFQAPRRIFAISFQRICEASTP